MKPWKSFPRRRNRDGTLDSICPLCAVITMQSSNPAELETAERAHLCEEWRLAQLKGRPIWATHPPKI